MSCVILFYFAWLCSLLKWDWKVANYKSHWNIVTIFEYVPRENIRFCFNFTVLVHFSNKTEKFWFWKSLKYFNIFWWRKIWCHIWIYPMEKCLILFHFHCLVIKLRYFDLNVIKRLWYFLIKNCCQILLCPVKQCLIWFKLCCLSNTL